MLQIVVNLRLMGNTFVSNRGDMLEAVTVTEILSDEEIKVI